ncbi:MAG: hypothetical protein OWT27_01135 [Firmicutes bacterium]|nr:hypothetical protein [Bacillota bacterium]
MRRVRRRGWRAWACWTTVSLSVAALVSGCWDYKDVEHLYYASTIGVDYREHGFTCYVQIINFSPLAKQEEATNGAEASGSWVGIGTGGTVDEAFHSLYAAAQRNIFWGQTKAVIVTTHLLKSPSAFAAVIDLLSRFPDTRYSIWLFATPAPLAKVLSVNPVLENSPVYSVLDNPLDMYRQSSYVAPVPLYRFMAQSDEPLTCAYLPLVAPTKDVWLGKDGRPMRSLRLSGAAWLYQGVYLGHLSRLEMAGWAIVHGQVDRLPVRLQPEGRRSPVVIAHSMGPANIRFVLLHHVWHARLRVRLGGAIIEQPKVTGRLDMRRACEHQIAQEIVRTWQIARSRNIDPYGLEGMFYRSDFHVSLDRLRFLRSLTFDPPEVHVILTNSGRTNKDAEPFAHR